MMLSKEECLQALEHLKEYVKADNVDDMVVFSRLIKEHFEPQPYKFEDLKEVIGNPIYDEKYKEFYILSEVKEEEVYKDEGIEKIMICSDKKGLIRVYYEENRFFPVQIANAG